MTKTNFNNLKKNNKNSLKKKKRYIKFYVYAFLIEMIYISFYFVKPLRNYFGDDGIILNNFNLFLLVVTFLLISLLLYILCYKEIIKNNIKLKTIILYFLLFNLTLLFVWPIGSTDIFSYICQGRVLSEHHLNPYITAYHTLNNDYFYSTINNTEVAHPSIYGPLFVIITSLLTFIGGNNFILTLFLFKFFFVAINLLCCYLIYKIFKNRKAVYLYAFNPLILYEFSINGHNDILIIFFVLLSLYILLKKENNIKTYSLSLFFLILSVLIKFISIIFIPIFLLILLFRIKSVKKKICFILLSFLMGAITISALYLPFWESPQTLSGLIWQTNRYSLIFISPLISMSSMLLHALRVANYHSLGIVLSKIFFVLFYLFLIVKIFIKRNKIKIEDLIKYFCVSLFVFYLSFFTWFMPWYLAFLITLIILWHAISKNEKYINIIHYITLSGILYYIVLR